MSKRRKITVKLLKIIAGVNVLWGTKLTVKRQDLASPCYINKKIDGVEHGGGCLGSFKANCLTLRILAFPNFYLTHCLYYAQVRECSSVQQVLLQLSHLKWHHGPWEPHPLIQRLGVLDSAVEWHQELLVSHLQLQKPAGLVLEGTVQLGARNHNHLHLRAPAARTFPVQQRRVRTTHQQARRLCQVHPPCHLPVPRILRRHPAIPPVHRQLDTRQQVQVTLRLLHRTRRPRRRTRRRLHPTAQPLLLILPLLLLTALHHHRTLPPLHLILLALLHILLRLPHIPPPHLHIPPLLPPIHQPPRHIRPHLPATVPHPPRILPHLLLIPPLLLPIHLHHHHIPPPPPATLLSHHLIPPVPPRIPHHLPSILPLLPATLPLHQSTALHHQPTHLPLLPILLLLQSILLPLYLTLLLLLPTLLPLPLTRLPLLAILQPHLSTVLLRLSTRHHRLSTARAHLIIRHHHHQRHHLHQHQLSIVQAHRNTVRLPVDRHLLLSIHHHRHITPHNKVWFNQTRRVSRDVC